jgi:hypothetical protein
MKIAFSYMGVTLPRSLLLKIRIAIKDSKCHHYSAINMFQFVFISAVVISLLVASAKVDYHDDYPYWLSIGDHTLIS